MLNLPHYKESIHVVLLYSRDAFTITEFLV